MRSMADLRTWRRLRQQRRAREAMLLDLGALVYELHRQGERAPELLQDKAILFCLLELSEWHAAFVEAREPVAA